MSVFNFIWRNVKWRTHNPITIIMGSIQPLVWLLLYSTVAGKAMGSLGGGNYTAFILPGILVLVVFTSAGSTGVANFDMKREGNFYRLMISPAKRGTILLGHMLEAVLFSFVEIAVLLLFSLLFSVRVASGFGGLLVMAVLLFFTSFFVAGISHFLGLTLPDENAFFTIINTLVLPIFFVSTALFPQGQITGALGVVVRLNPFTQVINSLRGLMANPVIDWGDVLTTAALFLVLSVLSYLLAVLRLKKTTNQ